MSLLDELRESPPPRERGQGRQAFLARLKEIEQAISGDFSSAEVWKHLNAKGLMPIKYRQFVRYVERYILSKKTEEKTHSAPTMEQQQPLDELEASTKKQNEPIKKTDEISKRFEHKPKPKEDLI